MNYFLILVLSLCLIPTLWASSLCDNAIREFFQSLDMQRSHYGLGNTIKYTAEGSADSLAYEDELILMSYNVLDLIEHKGKFSYENGLDNPVQIKPARAKPVKDQRGVAKAIKDVNPDIISLQEVDNDINVLQTFSDEHLGGGYRALLISGNDSRGIQIGFLVKKELPFAFELHSFKEMKVQHQGKERLIFSRDIPVLEVYAKDNSSRGPPLLSIAGMHLKSKRNLPNDPESKLLRTEQVKAAVEVDKMLEQKYGALVPRIFTGDFNTDVRTASSLTPLKERGFVDAFDIENVDFFGGSRTTHTYHPRDTPHAKKSQFDSIQLSSSLRAKNALTAAGIYRYLDAQGNVKAIPRSFDIRKENPSDHFPVYVNLLLRKLLSSKD